MVIENKHKISVIMSVYNTDEIFLRESIESILKQTYKNFEFLIFDDASTDDGIGEIISEYKSRDDRIIFIRNESNIGLTKTLNKGILLAKGDFIARIDSDDYSLPTRFQEQIDYLLKNDEISAVATAYYILKNGELKKHKNFITNSKKIAASLFFDNSYIQHSSIMLKTGFLRNNNLLYNEEIKKSQDYDFWVRITRKGNISLIKKYLSVYRVGDHQISIHSKNEQKKYKDEICINQLHELKINASETEKKNHLLLCDASENFNYNEIKNWIKILTAKNRETALFDRSIFETLLYYRYARMVLKKIIKNKELNNINSYFEILFSILSIIKIHLSR